MPEDVTNRLAPLPKMSKKDLLALWNQLFSGAPPSHLRRGLLIRLLAYKIQEQAYGGIKPANRQRLRELARKFLANPNAKISGVQRMKPGTRLIREWRGRTPEVRALETPSNMPASLTRACPTSPD